MSGIPDTPTSISRAGPSASNSGIASLHFADSFHAGTTALSDKAKGKRKAVEEIISVPSSSSSLSPPPIKRIRIKTKEEIDLENADTEEEQEAEHEEEGEEEEEEEEEEIVLMQSQTQKTSESQERAVANDTEPPETVKANPLSSLYANRRSDEEARRARQAKWMADMGKEPTPSIEDQEEDDELTVDQDEIESPMPEDKPGLGQDRRKLGNIGGREDASFSYAGSTTANANITTSASKNRKETTVPADERFWDGEMRGVFNLFSYQRDRSIKSFNVKDILGDVSVMRFFRG